MYEIHITADVAFALRQYLTMSEDVEMLTDGRLKEAAFAIADFWKARTTYNRSLNTYEILGENIPIQIL